MLFKWRLNLTRATLIDKRVGNDMDVADGSGDNVKALV